MSAFNEEYQQVAPYTYIPVNTLLEYRVKIPLVFCFILLPLAWLAEQFVFLQWVLTALFFLVSIVIFGVFGIIIIIGIYMTISELWQTRQQ
ncbi:MAG: hypothetical protein DRR08_29665 [Candidatus Parabeggiatoa sp. nov. 2]|nr:MAG: hypothetical protein B6247_31390 [Beggiatoa sp. 4572_84]RKZ51052.1 MAG: hypothetical protein DRR08_29665 [Gammaproteobacteria bacterium]